MRLNPSKFKLVRQALLAMVLLLLGGCTAESQYNSKYACNFVFYTQHHPTSSLAAINTGNPGFFVWVEVKKVRSLNTVYVYQNNGTADDPISLTSEIENNRLSYDNMGANKQLIIGCTTLNGLRAYDRQCPYCLETYSGTSYPLTWTDDGASVKCAKCSRVYSLNNEGICTTSSSEGSYRLLQYRVLFGTVYDGTTVLRVTN